MKKLFFIKALIISAITVLTAGCDVIHRDTIPSFIYGYYDLDEIGATIRIDNIIELDHSGNIICDWKSKGTQKQLYDSLCNAYNDIGYNRKIEYFVTPEEDKTVSKYKYDYYSINVTSDSDFDAEHPRGTSLNDIIMYYGTSVENFIDSGYSYEFNWDDTSIPGVYQTFTFLRAYYSTPVYRKLSEMTPEDYRLSLGLSCLVFEKEPALSKEHKLTVTVKNSAGTIVPISFYANGTRDNPRLSYVPITFE